MRTHLTEIAVRALRPTPSQTKVWDTQTAGFGVRVNGRTKSWFVMYGDKRQLKTLGHYPDMSLSEARQEAKRLLANPVPQVQEITFTEAVERFLATYSAQNHRPRTQKEMERVLRKHYLATLGARKLSAVDHATLMRIVDSLHKTPSQALHTFRAAHVFFNWAKGRRMVATNPLADTPPPSKDRQRDRTLSEEEIIRLWKTAEGKYGAIWKLLLLTGQRRSQIAFLEHAWVRKGTIEFPSEIMKGNRPHIIPLGLLAQEIIGSQPKGTLVFPGRWDAKKHFTGLEKLKRLHDAKAEVTGYTLHDLRRTFASMHAQIGTPIHVIEKLLDHTSGTLSGVAGIYNRYTYQKEMQEAVAHFDEHLRVTVAEWR